MSDLLKEAIADAKAVRETALENAKIALQEAFAPQLKSMLSAKLAEDDVEEGYDDKMSREEDDEEKKRDTAENLTVKMMMMRWMSMRWIMAIWKEKTMMKRWK